MNTKSIEVIEWLDHVGFGDASWKDLQELDTLTPLRVVSVGFVGKETKDYVTLVQTHINETDAFTGSMCILKKAITSRKKYARR